MLQQASSGMPDMQGLLDRQPGAAPFNRLQGEYQKFVQRQDASRIQDAARRRERQDRDTNESTLQTENSRLKAEVAELRAKLLALSNASSPPPADRRFGAATNFVAGIAGQSNEQQSALTASKNVSAELNVGSPTHVTPQQLSSTMEAMRLHDLLLHRQAAAARTIQIAYRAYRDRDRSKFKVQQRERSTASMEVAAPTAASQSRDASRLLGPKSGSSRGDLLRSDRSMSSGRIRSGLMQSDRSEATTSGRRLLQSARSSARLDGIKSPPREAQPERDRVAGVRDPNRFKAPERQETSMLQRFMMDSDAFVAGGRPKEAAASMSHSRLDRHIGEPSPAIFNAMEREHASEVGFASDMPKDTTPLSEWRYVIDEEVGSRSDRTHDMTPERVGWRLDDFVRCDMARKAGLTREEVIAVRLYTGPMSALYTAALREGSRDNFVTTIHAFNSALVKLSKVQTPTTVYRIMTIPDSPKAFFMPDANGACDAFEQSFFSATANKNFALRLLSEKKLHKLPRSRGGSGRESTIVLRIRVIPTDQAGNVSFASQSPLDEEVVFTALSTFEVVELHSSGSLRSTIAELRPRRGPTARTIDQVIGKMKRAHLEMLDMMIDELRAAGAPEPALLPLNTLRTKRSDLEDSDKFNQAVQFLEYTKVALDTNVRVLKSLTYDSAWRGERGTKEDVAKRMLAVVALQARAGEHDIAIEMTKLALQRASLSVGLRMELEDKEKHAAAVTSKQAVAVIKPSAIGKLFPPSQHSILEGAIYFLSLGIISPWPPLMAALLAKMSPAAHIVFGELVRAREGERSLGLGGSNVLVMPSKGSQWQRGIRSHDGSVIRVGRNEMKVIPSLRMLQPTDAGVGALLNEAAAHGDEALVSTLLRAKVDLRFSDDRANSALHRAVLGGHAKVCQSLMEAKADPMVRNMDGVSSWDLALCGTTGAVRRVFSPSCVDIDTALGSTPAAAVSEFAEQKEQVRQLLAASMRADVPRMKSVLEKVRPTMPIIDVPNLMLVSPLMFASLVPDGQAAVKVLLDAKANVATVTQHSATVLAMAAQAGALASVKMLLASNASVLLDQIDAHGYTPLHVAVENGHADVAKVLIDAGAKVDIARKNRWTCLMTAAFFGVFDVIEHLAGHGADINSPFVYTTQRDHTGAVHHATFRPIHLAAYNGFAETISMLGRLGADPNAYMGSGWTPLMIAAAQGHTTAVGALIEMRADVDYQNPLDGTSALMAAACNGTTPACLGLLLQAKANVHLKDDRDCDALMIASRLGHSHSVQQLLLQRANPRSSRLGGTTALMDAAAAGSDSVVELLVGGGADANAADEDGVTALMFAAKGGHELAMLPLLRRPEALHRVDKMKREAIAYATTRSVARRLLEAGANSTQLPAKFCVELGLPPPKPTAQVSVGKQVGREAAPQREPIRGGIDQAGGRGNVSPPRAPGTGRGAPNTGRSNLASSRKDMSARSSASPPRSGSVSPPRQRLAASGNMGAAAQDRKTPWVVRSLKADDGSERVLTSAMQPLVLEPTIAESAPLLKVFERNATPLQTGGAIIVQRKFREMRVRRFKMATDSFFMPRGTGLHGSKASILKHKAGLRSF